MLPRKKAENRKSGIRAQWKRNGVAMIYRQNAYPSEVTDMRARSSCQRGRHERNQVIFEELAAFQ